MSVKNHTETDTRTSILDYVGFLGQLYEASNSDVGGEVIARTGTRTARLYTVGNRIAWVTASTVKETLRSRLLRHGLVADQDLETVFLECRRTGENFAETLVRWGLIDRDRLRKELLYHAANCFLAVFTWAPPLAMFVPCDRSYRGTLTFSVDELMDVASKLDDERRTCLPGFVENVHGALDAAIYQLVTAHPSGGLQEAVVDRPSLQAIGPKQRNHLTSFLKSISTKLCRIKGYRAAAVLYDGEILLAQDPESIGIGAAAAVAARLLDEGGHACKIVCLDDAKELQLTTSTGMLLAKSAKHEAGTLVVVVCLDSEANHAFARHVIAKVVGSQRTNREETVL